MIAELILSLIELVVGLIGWDKSAESEKRNELKRTAEYTKRR